MTKEEEIQSIKNGNYQFLQDLKGRRPCFVPSWTNYTFFISRALVKKRSVQIKIEYYLSETKGGQILVIKN